jgi:hypothetical protein
VTFAPGPTELDDGALADAIARLEAEIEEHAAAIEKCRKIDVVAKAAIVVGGATIIMILSGLVGFHPTAMIGAFAAVIGGAVVYGSNTSTWQQTAGAMKVAEALRADLIARIDPRVVGDSRNGSGRGLFIESGKS